MNILLLTQIVPYPPDSGPKVKTYHVLRYLAEHGHRVTLVSFVRREEEKQLKHLEPFCAEIHPVPMRRSRVADGLAFITSLRSGLPFLVTRDDKPEMRRVVRQLAQKQQFDIVHADQLTMAQFAFDVNGAKRVFDAHNAVWAIVDRARATAPFFLRPVLARETNCLKKYEGRLCGQVDAVLSVSDVDRKALAQVGAPQDKISVISIAVDCTTMQPVTRTESAKEILTVSTLYYPPNADGVRWFIHQVYPLIRQRLENTMLTIVGPRPPQDLVEFGEQNKSAAKVTGYVPDLMPYLECAALMVVPVRAGSGMRVRILEALARGVPVVTTTTGVEGIDAVNGEHLLVADEPADFAAAVIRLLQDRALCQQIAACGRRLVEQKYDWQVALPKIESVYAMLRQSK